MARLTRQAIVLLVLGAGLGLLAQGRADQPADPLPPFARLRLGTLRFRTGAAVTYLGFLSDGKTLVTTDQGPATRFWDAATGRQLQHVPMSARAITRDGKWLAYVERHPGTDGVRVWDVAAGKAGPAMRGNAPRGSFIRLAFAPDGKTLAGIELDGKGRAGVVRLWDAATGAEARRLQQPKAKKEEPVAKSFEPVNIRFSPDGQLLAVVATPFSGSHFVVWSTATGAVVFVGAPEAPFSELDWQQELHRPQSDAGPLAFSPDSKQLASVNTTRGDRKVRLWDVATAKQVRDIGSFPLHHLSLLFSPTGRTLAVVSGDHKDRAVHLFDVRFGKELGPIPIGRSIAALAFSPDDKILAVADTEGEIRRWDIAAGKEQRHMLGFDAPAVDAAPLDLGQYLAFAPDGRTLFGAAGGLFRLDSEGRCPCAAGGLVRCWDVATGGQVHEDGGCESSMIALAGTQNGQRLVTLASDGAARLFDVAAGKELRRVSAGEREDSAPRHWNLEGAVAVSPDSKTLATAWRNSNIQLWDMATGKKLALLTNRDPDVDTPDIGVDTLAFDRSGKALVSSGTDGQVLWWDVPSARLRQPPGPPLGNEAEQKDHWSPGTFALAPDGRSLALAFTDARHHRLELWETATGKRRHTARLARMDVSPRLLLRSYYFVPSEQYPDPNEGVDRPGVAYSPDGKTLAWTIARTIVLWDMVRDREVRRFGVPEGIPEGATFSPDGKHLAAVTRDGAVHLWDTATGTALGVLRGHRGPVRCVTFVDNNTLASGGADTTVLLWDVRSVLAAGRAEAAP